MSSFFQLQNRSWKIYLFSFLAMMSFTIIGAQPVKLVSGNTNGTWTADTIYQLSGNVTVPVGQTLIIEHGVEVRFPDDLNGRLLIIQGTLNAFGTAIDSIKFTGGGFGLNRSRGPIIIEASSTNSILRFVKINALGYYNNSVTDCALILRSASCTIENCSFTGIQGTALSAENSGAIIRNNFFTGSANFDINVGIDNLPDITGNNPLKVGLRGDAMTANASLSANNVYYSLLATFTVPTGQTLTIEPGVEVLFAQDLNARQLIVQGTINAVGSVTDSIKFTGGGFGLNRIRGPIIIEATSNNSRLSYVKVNALGYYANSETDCVLILRSATCVVENCSFLNSYGTAISFENAGAIVRNNFFAGSLNLDVNVGLDNLPKIIGNNPLKIGLRGSEVMTTNTTLVGANVYYYMLSTITVPTGKILTIQPKVELMFPQALNPPQLIIQGTLNAVGTITDSIKFTGGGFGLNRSRGPVVIEALSNSSTLRYVKINTLGYFHNSEATSVLQIKTSSCIIENCNIVNNQGVGISVLNNILPTIKNNSFSGNNNGDISGYAKGFTNIFNNTNAKILLLTTTIDQNTSLPYPGTNSYYLLSGILTVNQGFNFTLSPGTIIDFRSNAGNIVVNGSLSAIGTETGIIQLKKIASTGNTTLGGTLSFGTTSIGSVLRNVLIDKLGNTTAPAKGSAIEINTNNISLENINVTNCTATGLKINNAIPTITGSNFLNNATAVLSTGGQAIFNDCSFVGNTIIAISNTSGLASDSIDAKNCWWGAPSGPRHILNTSGTGDTIAAKVKFLPFKTAATPSLVICPGGNTYLQIAPAGTGYTYQWQVDNGTGFTNLANSSLHSGIATTTLTLTGAPSMLYGYKYRVVASLEGTSIVYAAQTIKFGVNWTGTLDTAWENADNWSCGIVPDDNTDIVVPDGVLNTPTLNSNKSCRSLNLQNGASVIVKSGYNLTIRK